MATATFVNFGSAQGVVTQPSIPYPTSIVAGNGLLMVLSSNTTSASNISDIPATNAGFTVLGSGITGTGICMKLYTKDANGSESGSVSWSGHSITGGTIGVGQIIQYAPQNTGDSLTFYGTYGDQSTPSTTYNPSGSSVTSAVGDLLAAFWSPDASSGTFSATMASSGVTLAQAGVTLGTQTGRESARAGTNVITYGLKDAPVTVGGTGAPSLSGTTTGASAQGPSVFVFIHESAPTNTKALSAGLTLTGSQLRATTKLVTASLSVSGSVVKATIHLLAASLSVAGSLTNSIVHRLTAGLSSSGSLLKSTSRPLAAGLTLAGTLQRQTGRTLPGALTVTGSVGKRVGKTLPAGLTLTGAQTKQVSKTLTGTLSSTGGVGRLVVKGMSAGLRFAGTLIASGQVPVNYPITVTGTTSTSTVVTGASAAAVNATGTSSTLINVT